MGCGCWCPWLSLGVVTARVGATRGGVWVLVSMAVPWCGDSPCWSSASGGPSGVDRSQQIDGRIHTGSTDTQGREMLRGVSQRVSRGYAGGVKGVSQGMSLVYAGGYHRACRGVKGVFRGGVGCVKGDITGCVKGDAGGC